MSRFNVSICILLSLLMTAGLFAQGQAPAGNAQPTGDVVEPGTIQNPLDPSHESRLRRVTPEEKIEFAAKVNLDPLRDLAVMANSRVGVLSTVANETVSEVTGRRKYQDLIPDEDGRLKKVSYDPMFTFFDFMADQAYYFDKPVIHVEYLDLRRGLLRAEFPDDEEQRERFLKLTRLAPSMVFGHPERLDPYLSDNTYTRAIGQLDAALNFFLGAYTRLQVVSPQPGTTTWTHAAAHPESARLFAEMGQAWRALDHETVNRVVGEIAQTIPAIHPETYPPDWRRTLEDVYNGASKFVIGYTLYFFSFVTLLIAMGTNRLWLRRAGVLLLLSGLTIHAAGFAIRWILADRIPIQNQFESMLGLCLGACLFGTITMFIRRQTIFGAAAGAVGFLTLMTATLRAIPGQEIRPEAAILNTSYILFYHVNIVLFSYGLIAIGVVISLFYLMSHYFGGESTSQLVAAGLVDPARLNDSSESTQTGRQRLLNDLDHAQMVVLQLAFWILGVGILLGAWWADHSWGRWWAFDPKETWALITWIIYLIIVHVRFGVKNRGLVTAWLSIVGFIMMLWTYFGVNLLLPGLHAYA